MKDSLLLQMKLTKNIIETKTNKYLKSYNISHEQAMLLKVVYEVPGLSQTQLAGYLHKDKTTITRMIDTLVKKGKLRREISTEDRRVFQIYVTDETKKGVEELSPIFEKQEMELRNIISDNDYYTTLEVFEKIKKYYKELNA
ncbi:MarR family winged helix-turn-helix transcriptional regulator [Sulfurospirillum sp. 1612]|uniref:MarR family winged helix-turn-helix transcriptional regulator n=1 Tax=Sulfurospirillum sp. 1612 TaxID=3094835 RepID=UPI002F932D81